MSRARRLYRFLSADTALKTIASRLLRVGRITEFNDPFEWRVGVSGVLPQYEHHVRAAQQQIVDQLSATMGVVCFSDTIEDPILWSHYADHHRGVALEVEYLDVPSLYRVEYSNDRPTVDASRLADTQGMKDYLMPIVRSLFTRKSSSWAYEREYRAFVDLTQCESRCGMFFVKIPPDFLKRVVLGFRCSLEVAAVQDAIVQAGLEGVVVEKAKDSCESYAIRC
jgi:Protein of unknown function (DUF2971)